MAGDWPAKIAQKFGASKRPRWLPELYRANPHKTTLDGNWRLLAPGETINLPDEWSQPAAHAGDVGDPLLGDDFANRHLDLLRAPRGPSRDAQIIDALADHLKGATQARMEARDDGFRKVLTAARAMYGHAFDPEHLATGNPFVIFTHGMAPESARRLCDALISGQEPLSIFRQLDQEHRARLIDRAAGSRLRCSARAAPRGPARGSTSPPWTTSASRSRAPCRTRSGLRRCTTSRSRRFIRGRSRRSSSWCPLSRCTPTPSRRRSPAGAGRLRTPRGSTRRPRSTSRCPARPSARIAEKLVRDGDRWIELDACNPARRQGDPRLRIPPNWFAYIPYAAPSDAIEALAHNPILKRIMAGEDINIETGDVEHDRVALEGLRHNPLVRRALVSGAAVDGTTLRG